MTPDDRPSLAELTDPALVSDGCPVCGTEVGWDEPEGIHWGCPADVAAAS